MSESKILRLLASMPPRELEEFSDVIQQQKRESLKTLLRQLSHAQQTDVLDKGKLFADLFGKPYQKESDYLWRNEVRLLRERLFRFWAEKELLQDLRSNEALEAVYLQKALAKRKLNQDLKRNYTVAHKKATRELKREEAVALNRDYFYFLIRNTEFKPEAIPIMQTCLQAHLQHLKHFYRSEVARNQQARSVLRQISSLMGKSEPGVEVGPDRDFAAVSDSMILFFENLAKGNQSLGQEKLSHVTAAVEAIRPLGRVYPDRLIDGLSILAMAEYVSRNYQQARKHFEEAEALAREARLPLRLNILFNYCSTLIRLHEYSQALTLIEERYPEIQANNRVRFRFEGLYAFCFIFLKQPEKARAILPARIGSRARSEYQYFRFIFCILPYLRDDWEDGLRESTNFLAYFYRKSGELEFPEEKTIALAFKNFYKSLLDQADPALFHQELSEISQSLETFMQQMPKYRDYLYISWLQAEIAKRMTG